jgi:uncharacterized protein YdaL
MSTPHASRDQNRVESLLAVSNADGLTPVVVTADPVTGRILVNAVISGTVAVSSAPSYNNVKLVRSGTALYVAKAAPGTAAATSAWQAFKYDSSTGLVTWAGGNANFTNPATSLATLTYS